MASYIKYRHWNTTVYSEALAFTRLWKRKSILQAIRGQSSFTCSKVFAYCTFLQAERVYCFRSISIALLCGSLGFMDRAGISRARFDSTFEHDFSHSIGHIGHHIDWPQSPCGALKVTVSEMNCFSGHHSWIDLSYLFAKPWASSRYCQKFNLIIVKLYCGSRVFRGNL